VSTAPTTPRIPPLPPREWPEEMRGALAALVPANPLHPLPIQGGDRPKGLNALGTLARYPVLTRAFHTFDGHILFGASISVRQRELIVLRLAHLRDCEYEWKQHVVQGTDAGITLEEIDRVAEGPDATGWSPLEQAIVRAVDELVRDAVISDETWTVLASELDVHQLMDLVFTVGCYELIAMFFKSVGVQVDDDLQRYLDRSSLERPRPS
jgi:alkylhydroperoxidase family enzyme